MKLKNRYSILYFSAFVILGLITLVGILSLLNIAKKVSLPGPTASAQATQIAATATSAWNVLLEKNPVAYTTPLPALQLSPLDGTYTKVDPSWPQWWLCRRCADYRPAGGIWKIQFDKGVMRIYYEVTGWTSLASFTASDDRLQIFNDPYCPEDVGEYMWKLDGGDLRLEVISDACSFDLRAKNLSKQSWSSCLSPDETSGVSDQSPKSPGCVEYPVIPTTAPSSNQQVAASVYGGDSRFFEKPPDILVHANSADSPPPDGIHVTYHQESIPFGLNRVLWWNGDWIQATVDLSVTSIGVQFLGEPQTGWARVLFDGEEVWRGKTSSIWSGLGRHGGYIEVSGFRPGVHTIRAESLGFDFHPVTVANFGFNYQGGVEIEKP